MWKYFATTRCFDHELEVHFSELASSSEIPTFVRRHRFLFDSSLHSACEIIRVCGENNHKPASYVSLPEETSWVYFIIPLLYPKCHTCELKHVVSFKSVNEKRYRDNISPNDKYNRTAICAKYKIQTVNYCKVCDFLKICCQKARRRNFLRVVFSSSLFFDSLLPTLILIHRTQNSSRLSLQSISRCAEFSAQANPKNAL